METKEEKFKRLATLRVNNTIKCIDLIGNLSNRSTYDYSDEEIRKIFSVLNDRIKEVKSRFKSQSSKKEFEL